MNNKLTSGLVGLILGASTSPIYAEESRISNNNLERLSQVTQECKTDVDNNPNLVDSYTENIFEGGIEGIETYLNNPTGENLYDVQGISFTQVFQGMRNSPCYVLPGILGDIERGIDLERRDLVSDLGFYTFRCRENLSNPQSSATIDDELTAIESYLNNGSPTFKTENDTNMIYGISNESFNAVGGDFCPKVPIALGELKRYDITTNNP